MDSLAEHLVVRTGEKIEQRLADVCDAPLPIEHVYEIAERRDGDIEAAILHLRVMFGGDARLLPPRQLGFVAYDRDQAPARAVGFEQRRERDVDVDAAGRIRRDRTPLHRAPRLHGLGAAGDDARGGVRRCDLFDAAGTAERRHADELHHAAVHRGKAVLTFAGDLDDDDRFVDVVVQRRELRLHGVEVGGGRLRGHEGCAVTRNAANRQAQRSVCRLVPDALDERLLADAAGEHGPNRIGTGGPEREAALVDRRCAERHPRPIGGGDPAG